MSWALSFNFIMLKFDLFHSRENFIFERYTFSQVILGEFFTMKNPSNAQRGRQHRSIVFQVINLKYSIRHIFSKVYKSVIKTNVPITKSQSNDTLTWAIKLHSNEVTIYTLRPHTIIEPGQKVSDFATDEAICVYCTDHISYINNSKMDDDEFWNESKIASFSFDEDDKVS